MLLGDLASRSEHLYVVSRGLDLEPELQKLRAAGFHAVWADPSWGHRQIQAQYVQQSRKFARSLSATDQPHFFMSDTQWWHHHGNFRTTPPHLVAHLSPRESSLEREFSDRGPDWMYAWGADSRDRFQPELLRDVYTLERTGESTQASSRAAGAAYLRKYYPELVAPLAWIMPQVTSKTAARLYRMRRDEFRTRAAVFRRNHPLPDGLTSGNLVDYLYSIGLAHITNGYYLRFGPCYLQGLHQLKLDLTFAAINEMLKK